MTNNEQLERLALLAALNGLKRPHIEYHKTQHGQTFTLWQLEYKKGGFQAWGQDCDERTRIGSYTSVHTAELMIPADVKRFLEKHKDKA